jgi:hypothetical protein
MQTIGSEHNEPRNHMNTRTFFTSSITLGAGALLSPVMSRRRVSV